MSQEALGALLSVAGASVSRYETENSKLRAVDLPRIAEALGVHPCDFFDPPPVSSGEALSAADRIALSVLRQDLAPEDLGLMEGIAELLRRRRTGQ